MERLSSTQDDTVGMRGPITLHNGVQGRSASGTAQETIRSFSGCSPGGQTSMYSFDHGRCGRLRKRPCPLRGVAADSARRRPEPGGRPPIKSRKTSTILKQNHQTARLSLRGTVCRSVTCILAVQRHHPRQHRLRQADRHRGRNRRRRQGRPRRPLCPHPARRVQHRARRRGQFGRHAYRSARA